MTIKGNYRMLFELRADLLEQSRKSIVFRTLHQKNIQFFKEYNKATLAKAEAIDAAMVKKYVVHDETGKPVIEKQEHGLVYYRFHDEAARQNFGREYQAMLATECTIGL